MTRSPCRRTMVAVALGGCLTLAGCGAADAPSDSSGRDTIVQPTDDVDPTATRSTSAAPGPTTQPDGGASTDPGAPPETAVPPDSSGGVVDLALQDLANRLGVGIDQITVTRNEDVTWRDGSLGCAKKGMAYITMLVEGHLVVLESGGTSYEYHAAKAKAPFLCDNPQPPLRTSS